MMSILSVRWLIALLCGCVASAEVSSRDDYLQNLQPCSAEVHELKESVSSLLTLKGQLEATQNYVRAMFDVVQKTQQYIESLEAGAAERRTLREDTARLRAEVSTCRSEVREARSAHQIECVAKVMSVSNEAQREVAAARTQADQCIEQFKTYNQTQSTQLEELKAERDYLRLQLSAAKLGCPREDAEAQSSAETLVVPEPASSRGGRGATDPWSRPKLSPGKESSVSKIPPANYKHSCKGFMDATASSPASPQETSIRISNRQYIVGKNEVTWGEAWRICKARGMWILSLESEQEQQQLEPHMMHMHNTPTKYWLFARKRQGSAWYSWECAASDDVEPWRLPTMARAGAGASVRCAHVELHAGDVVWGDDICDQKHHYICRKLVTEC